jgi:hypothetical protein
MTEGEPVVVTSEERGAVSLRVRRDGELDLTLPRTVAEFLGRSSEKDHWGELTLDTLRPDSPTFAGLIKTYFGDNIVDTLKKQKTTTRDGQLDTTRTNGEINTAFYAIIKESLGLEDNNAAQQTFQRAREYAKTAIDDHAQLIGFSPRHTNEMMLNETPADMLRTVFASKDPRTQFELQRQFMLTILALQQEKLQVPLASRKLTQVFDFINNHVAGENEPEKMTLYGIFDDETNELVGSMSEQQPSGDVVLPPGQHYKAIKEQVTTLPTGEKIIIIVDKKTPSSAIRKTVRAAHFKGTLLQPEKIEDFTRMKILVLGKRDEEYAFAEQTFDQLTKDSNAPFFANDDDSDGAYNGRGGVRVGNKEGKGKKPVGYTKILMEFKGVKIPIEIVVQTYDEHVKNSFAVGKFDNMKGDYTGPAHALFAIAREGDLSEIFFPNPPYTDKDDQGIIKNLHRTAQRLREQERYDLTA